MSPTRCASSRRIARRTCCSNTRSPRASRGLRVIIAGAGGAAHLPGMMAAKTSLPVLGVPVQSKALQRHRFAAVDRADAGGRAGRHAGDRRRGRDERRAARHRHPRDDRYAARHRARRVSRATDRRACWRRPTRARPDRNEDRHRRCRPARAHAGGRRIIRSVCTSSFSIRAPTRPAGRIAPIVIGAFDDAASLRELAARTSTC